MARSRRRKIEAKAGEPHWAPLPRQHHTRLQTASIVARHLVPLACLWLFGGSVRQFLLLTVFNLVFTVASIVAVGVGVSTRQERAPVSRADAVASLGMLALVCAGISLVLSTLFGWTLAVVASHEEKDLWDATLWWSVLAIVISALPGMVMQYRDDLSSSLSDERRKQRDQPAMVVHLFSAGFIFLLTGWTLGWGRFGAIVMALAVTALFVFRDLRPDLARELTRPNNRPP